jgi:hypothetical protein
VNFALVDNSLNVGESGGRIDQLVVLKKYRWGVVGENSPMQIFATISGSGRPVRWRTSSSSNLLGRCHWTEHRGELEEHTLPKGWRQESSGFQCNLA